MESQGVSLPFGLIMDLANGRPKGRQAGHQMCPPTSSLAGPSSGSGYIPLLKAIDTTGQLSPAATSTDSASTCPSPSLWVPQA